MIRIGGRVLACRECGQPATSYYGQAGRPAVGGCDAHPVLVTPAAGLPFGTFAGLVPVAADAAPFGIGMAAAHTWTPGCAGIHPPGGCPPAGGWAP